MGFRPFDGTTAAVNPPAFVWRPQKNAARYELQVAADEEFTRLVHESGPLEMYCHCPPRPRVKLVECHLTAATPSPRGECQFVTVLRPYRTSERAATGQQFTRVAGGLAVEAELTGNHRLIALL